MSGAVAPLFAAAAGAMAAAAMREAVLAAPALQTWLEAAMEPLRRAAREGYAPTREEFRRLAALGSGALLCAGLALAGPGPAALPAVAGPAVAAWAIRDRRERYRRSVERALPEIALAVADALAAGRSLRNALAGAASSLDGPPAVEMGRLAADLDLGVPTEASLRSLAARVRSSGADSLVAALAVQRLSGGDLSLLLRRFAAAAAERDRVNEDARAATAQARFTGLLVVAMPTGGALFGELMSPGFLGAMLADPAATGLLLTAAALQVAGFFAIRRLSGSFLR